uniref:Beta-microseminoprotein n=1 Tax=Cyprinodon variegatus TaxID=28743 RepID=A0A3Q2CTC4_CYPVA
ATLTCFNLRYLNVSYDSFFHVTETENQTHCQDNVDLTWHLKESNWTNSKCLDCNCKSCCTGYATPVKFPKDCVSVFDEKTCQYIVHKKDDPSALCPIYAAVGK